MTLDSICVFCGSRPGVSPDYARVARNVGETLAKNDIRLVFGGGSVGLMGAVADGVVENGGTALGVIPRGLADRERMHPGVEEMIEVETMHQRKARMEREANAFVALPGGMGTLEEFTEIFTWGQLGIHTKPFGLLNINGYFNPFVGFLDHMVNEGFLEAAHRDLVTVSEDFDTLLESFRAWKPPETRIWLSHEET